MTDPGNGKGRFQEEVLSETVWRALILASSAAVVLFSVYCLSHGITIIFMHLYYFPIVLLAYRYRLKGFVLAVLLSLIYVGLVLFYAFGQTEIITGALYRFVVFVGIAAVIAYLSDRLAAAQTARNEALDTIRDLQQFQQSVIENAYVWITVLAPDGTILVWNDAAEAVSGYKHEEVLGNNAVWKHLYPDKEYRRKVTGEIKRIINRDNYLEDFETEIRCTDGSAKVIVWNTRGLKGADEGVQSYIAIGRDITEQKRSVGTIRDLQQFQQSVIENAYVWITVLAPDGTILVWNDAAEAVSGYKHEEVLGNNAVWKRLYPDKEYRRKITGEIRRIVERDNYLEDLETEIRCGDGSVKVIVWNTRGLKGADEGVQSYIAIGRDITEQKRAESALRQNETLLTEVGEMAKVGGWSLDVETKEVRWTSETYRIHDIPEGENYDLAKAVLFFEMPGRSTLEAALQRCMVTGEPFDLELPFTSAKGRHLWTRAMGRAVKVDRKIVNLTGTVQDITERKKAEEKIKRSMEQFKTVMDSIDALVYVADMHTFEILFINKYGIDTWGEIEGKVCWQTIQSGQKGQCPFCTNNRLVDPDGHPTGIYNWEFQNTVNGRWYDCRDSAIRWLDGRLVRLEIATDITERKQMEETLHESEQKFRDLFENSRDGIFIADTDTRKFIDSNGMFSQMLGYNPEEIKSLDVRDIHPKESLSHILEMFEKLVRHEINISENIPVKRKDGSIFYANISAYPINTFNKIYFAGVFRDITERKRAERDLQETKDHLENLIGHANAPIITWDPEFRITEFNHAFETLTGMSRQEVMGQPLEILFLEQSTKGSMDLIRRTSSGERWEVVEIPIRHVSGKTSTVLWNSANIKNSDGKIIATIAQGQDITDRKRTENELKLSNILLSTQQEVSIDGILVVDDSGKIISYNKRFMEIWGISPDVIASRSDERTLQSVLEKLVNPQEFLDRVRSLYGHKNEKSRDEIALSDGRILDRYSAPMTGIDGVNYGRVWFFRDITDMKKAEMLLKRFNEELEQKVKSRTEELNASLQAKILLLREVHHRVKNNLQIIISLVNLQMRQLESPQLKQVMAETQNRVKAMSIVHEKLYQSESLSQIDLADYSRYLATQLFSFYGTDSSRVKLDIGIERIMVDINTAIPVGLIINELVSNALKHAFPAGRGGTISISGRSDDDTLTLVVKDDGIGMPPDLDWKNPESLGLRLVTSLVEQLDGTIELDRSSGTAFTIAMKEKE